jgi:hypothetical protein
MQFVASQDSTSKFSSQNGAIRLDRRCRATSVGGKIRQSRFKDVENGLHTGRVHAATVATLSFVSLSDRDHFTTSGFVPLNNHGESAYENSD